MVSLFVIDEQMNLGYSNSYKIDVSPP